MIIKMNDKTYSVVYYSHSASCVRVSVRVITKNPMIRYWRQIDIRGKVARKVIAKANSVDAHGQAIMNRLASEIANLRVTEETEWASDRWVEGCQNTINAIINEIGRTA